MTVFKNTTSIAMSSHHHPRLQIYLPSVVVIINLNGDAKGENIILYTIKTIRTRLSVSRGINSKE